MNETISALWTELLQESRIRPYVFKTRLQRAIMETKKYCNDVSDNELLMLVARLEDNMRYISDQSNQTSDGELKSYALLYDDIEAIVKYVTA